MRINDARLATEPPKYGLADQFDVARAFQNRTVEWIHEGTSPVAVARAPTGAGKTATFVELISESDMALLVYPTNALLRQQRERLAADGISARVLDASTLSGTGYERKNDLKQYAQRFLGHDAVVTNPDILQAIVQGLYVGNDAMEFFDAFDAVVYDEFHFYGDLAASGLLLQIKIISQRVNGPKILLASATPNEDFVAFIADRLNLDVDDIAAEYVEDGDPFRHAIELIRREDRSIFDARESVCERLAEEIDRFGGSVEPHIALIFNSAVQSNEFHRYLKYEHPDVFEVTAKDNGFDTNDPDANLDDEEFFILNTTNKGEVGLDHDIRTLFMDTPREASAFIQRFGRAGRQHDAQVHTFGLGEMGLPDEVSYPKFVDRIWDSLASTQMAEEKLVDLIGLRAKYAVRERSNADGRFSGNPEVLRDFQDIETYDQWSYFVDVIERELNVERGPFDSQLGRAENLLRFAEHCLGTFRSLRGRSLPAEVQYPRGDRSALTSYDLLSTLRNYDIRAVDERVLVLTLPDNDRPNPVTIRLPGYEQRPKDYSGPNWEIDRDLHEWIQSEIDRFGEKTDVPEGLLHRFFGRLDLTKAILPTMVRCGRYQIDVDASTGRPTIKITGLDL